MKMARKGENIFKRKDGRWEGRYVKGKKNGKNIYGFVYGRSYKEAKEKKQEACSRLKEQIRVLEEVEQSDTMDSICRSWLRNLSATRREATIAKYYNQLEKHILPYFGEYKFSEITNGDIINFSQLLLNEKKLSAKTTSDILSRMKSIRQYALLQGYKVNYISNCTTIHQSKCEIRILSTTEQKTLIKHLVNQPNLTNIGILICLFSGIRIGELCALRWNDISLENKELHVSRTMQRLQCKALGRYSKLQTNDSTEQMNMSKTYIHIDAPKSKCSIRTIPLSDKLIGYLKQEYICDAYVLTGKKDYYIEPRTMENRFKSVLKQCDIEDANFHALRHSFATRCVEAGFDIKSLSEILGHANISITLNRYVHPTMKMKHENMKKLAMYVPI